MSLVFVGINQPEIDKQTDENATLTFKARVTPTGPYSRTLAVAFDIAEYATARLDRSKSKDGKRMFSWFSHWKPARDASGNALFPIDDDQYVETDPDKYKKNKKTGESSYKGPSVASIFRLTFLEQLGMRESDAYKNAIDALPADKFSDEDKEQLKKIAGSHGKNRGGIATVADKTEKAITALKEQGDLIVSTDTLTAAQKADLADKIETASTEIVTACRKPLEEQDKVEAERRKLEAEIDKAKVEIHAALNSKEKAAPEQLRKASLARAKAEVALANLNTEQVTPEPAPEAEPTAEAEPNANAEQTEPTAEAEPNANAEQTEPEQTEQDKAA